MLDPVAARLAGRPLAFGWRALDALMIAGSAQARDLVAPAANASTSEANYTVTDTGIAIVPIIGPLVTRSDWLSVLLGAISYGEVADAVEAASTDPAIRAVLLEVDSPGGEIGGLFDLVDRISGLARESGKPLWAAASESALSAAFAIASVAERIYVTRTAEAGSVGIVAAHVDESGADAAAGLKWTLVHAGAKKIDGNPHEPLTDSARADLQADVDRLHADFIEIVARNRGMTTEAVRATEAAVYRGARAVEIGFADRLGTVDLALSDLAGSLARHPPGLQRLRAASPQRPRSLSAMTTEPAAADTPAAIDPTPPPENPESEITEAPIVTAQPAPLTQPAPGQPGAAATSDAERLRAEFADVAAIAAQAARLGVTVDAAEAMRKGIKPDALRRSVLDTLAQRAEANVVVSAAPASANPGESPIVRRAQERAAAARK